MRKPNCDPFAQVPVEHKQPQAKIELPEWPHSWFPGEPKTEVKPKLTVVKPITPINPHDVVQVVFRDLYRRDPTPEERIKWQDYLTRELTNRLRPFKR